MGSSNASTAFVGPLVGVLAVLVVLGLLVLVFVVRQRRHQQRVADREAKRPDIVHMNWTYGTPPRKDENDLYADSTILSFDETLFQHNVQGARNPLFEAYNDELRFMQQTHGGGGDRDDAAAVMWKRSTGVYKTPQPGVIRNPLYMSPSGGDSDHDTDDERNMDQMSSLNTPLSLDYGTYFDVKPFPDQAMDTGYVDVNTEDEQADYATVEAAGAASSGTLYLDLDTVANATASVDDDDDLSSEDQYLAHAELYEKEDKDSLDSVD